MKLVHNLPDTIWNGFSATELQEVLDAPTDALLSRQEYKFLIPLAHLPDVLSFLKRDFLLITHDQTHIYEYRTVYFDTADHLFFRLHRQGKYNRIKIRVRAYENGAKAMYGECKEKVKGARIEKKRQPITHQSQLLQSKMVQQYLDRYTLTPKSLTNTTEVFYHRVNLISPSHHQRISIDADIHTTSHDNKRIDLIPEYGVLEIKSKKPPQNIIHFLRSHYKIHQSNFSKYCISVCLTNPHLKRNKWKQIFKKYFPLDTYSEYEK